MGPKPDAHLWGCSFPPVLLPLPIGSWLFGGLSQSQECGWSRGRPGSGSEGSAQVLAAQGNLTSPGEPFNPGRSRATLGLPQEDHNTIQGVALKTFLCILEWSFGAKPDFGSILSGQIHLEPNAFLRAEEVKLWQVATHSADSRLQ